MARVGVEHVVHLLLEALRHRARTVGELVLHLLCHLLQLGLHELRIGAGLLTVEHTRADLDRVRHGACRIAAGLRALAHQPGGGLVLDHEPVDRDAIADRGDPRMSEGRGSFHEVPVARYAPVLTEPLGRRSARARSAI